MSKFDYKTELNRIIDTKQLTEIQLDGFENYKVAYLLNVNREFLTFSELNPAGLFAGVFMCQTSDIESIKIDSLYLQQFAKKKIDPTALPQAQKIIKNIKNFDFDGLLSAFAGSSQIVNLIMEGDNNFAGRIINFSDKIIVLDEYYTEYGARFSRMYASRNKLVRISIDENWTKTIGEALAEKKL